MLLDARYVPGPISDPAACSLSCYEARDETCTCWCGGRNHGIYTRPVRLIDTEDQDCAIVTEEYMEVLPERTIGDCEELILSASQSFVEGLIEFLATSLNEGATATEIYAVLEDMLSGTIEIV